MAIRLLRILMKKNDVRDAYRALLRRDPESDQIVKKQIAEHKNLQSLLTAIVGSPEFRSQSGSIGVDQLGLSNGRIEVEVDAVTLATLLRRTTEQWTALGEKDPYWSVLSDEKFRIESFETHSQSFWDSGVFVLNELDDVINQHSISVNYGTVVELGCGVGRLTRFLAERFEHTIALDISPGNLEICRAETRTTKGSVEPTLIQNPQELEKLPHFDLFVSYIVLQHNPPPIQYFVLNSALKLLRPGGLAMFQVPTMGMNYEFVVKNYLSEKAAEMDMHVLPFSAIFKIFKQNDLTCIDIKHDFQAGPAMLSNTFVAIKN